LRGDTLHAHGAALVVTYHPSSILRADERADALFASLVEDLQRAAGLARGEM
jgi:uracil-DNA glycosylase